MNYRFQKIDRLNADEFEIFKQHGKKRVLPFFIALSYPSKHAKVGVIIGKKSVPRAVDRNHCRRIVRESFRYNCANIKHQVILIVRHKATTVDNKALFQCLERYWKSLTKSAEKS